MYWPVLVSYLKDFVQENKLTRTWDRHLYESRFNDVQSKVSQRIKENLAVKAIEAYLFVLSSGEVSPACCSFVKEGQRIYRNIPSNKLFPMTYQRSNFGIKINGACCKEVFHIFLIDGLALLRPDIFCQGNSHAGRICKIYASYVVRAYEIYNPVVEEHLVSDSDSDVEVILPPKRFRVA